LFVNARWTKSDMLSRYHPPGPLSLLGLYHVGMSPSAEVMPKLKLNLPTNGETVSRTLHGPPNPTPIGLQPTILVWATAYGPVTNHAFNCVKTMGP
jgi:hypothetical protein